MVQVVKDVGLFKINLMKYEEVKNNEWTELGLKNQDLICCDCNLVHTIDFKIKDGKLFAKFRRNEKATAAIRRNKK